VRCGSSVTGQSAIYITHVQYIFCFECLLLVCMVFSSTIKLLLATLSTYTQAPTLYSSIIDLGFKSQIGERGGTIAVVENIHVRPRFVQ
jgi:hypothetical protein